MNAEISLELAQLKAKYTRVLNNWIANHSSDHKL